MGNPTTYRGKTATWNTHGKLTEYNNCSYTYYSNGQIETNTQYDAAFGTYYPNSKVYCGENERITQAYGIDILYNGEEEIGISYISTKYFFRKDALGNVIALIDANGTVVARYIYDAWGNHKVLNASGVEITDPFHIANMNPIRYRGYFYDYNCGLYYLKSRYYDPETGRFISPDSIEYIDPETINGLNLYAYCGDNPVMYVDPNGHFGIVATLLVGALVGAVISATSSIAVQLITDKTIDWGDVGISAFFGAVSGAFAITGVGGFAGQFLIQGALAVSESLTTAAINNEMSSIHIGEEIVNFMFNGILGGIGAKSAAANFKRFVDIGNSLSKVVSRELSKRGLKSAAKTLLKKGGKFFKEMGKYVIKQSIDFVPETIFDYWLEKAN